TKGYRHHPQLARFRASSDPLTAIATYLKAVHEESRRRGYRFDASKILGKPTRARLRVTRGQLDYEWEHLRSKLKRRDPQAVARRKAVRRVIAHPLFRVVPGDVEEWERRRQ
ncbi:MAG TPA: pyrimidine dimer DNA glycosylase/endonuclease V, partial [Terriglobia bacterium]|nr:pyrimidine dimer DNA glycosylase/endonuclease V [Terriglobia bacterium]